MGYIVVSRGTHTQHTAGLLGDGDLLSIRKQAGTGTSSQFDSKRAGTGTSIRKQGVTHPLLATHLVTRDHLYPDAEQVAVLDGRPSTRQVSRSVVRIYLW